LLQRNGLAFVDFRTLIFIHKLLCLPG
jgi:hypothetical protein